MEYFIAWKNDKIICSGFSYADMWSNWNKSAKVLLPLLETDKFKTTLETDIHKYTIDDCLLAGTEFQKKVWLQISKIPIGQTRTYGHIKNIIGGSAQAIGTACGKNPVPVCVPCHRVVGIKNKLAFSSGPEVKRELLRLEGVII